MGSCGNWDFCLVFWFIICVPCEWTTTWAKCLGIEAVTVSWQRVAIIIFGSGWLVQRECWVLCFLHDVPVQSFQDQGDQNDHLWWAKWRVFLHGCGAHPMPFLFLEPILHFWSCTSFFSARVARHHPLYHTTFTKRGKLRLVLSHNLILGFKGDTCSSSTLFLDCKRSQSIQNPKYEEKN